MTKRIDVDEAAGRLMMADRILVLSHRRPDGDTIGSALAITAALRKVGKTARAVWIGDLTKSYSLITSAYVDCEFEPEFILAVDTADLNLFPDETRAYGEKADMCIDHHGSNSGYARELLLDEHSASCCEIIARVIDAMGVEMDTYIASCIYLGLATDTGCFRYSNTTSGSHLLAARLQDLGVDEAEINRQFFEMKSRAKVDLERRAMAGMEFTLGGRICFLTITQQMMAEAHCSENDFEGIASIPRGIEGVEAGVTLREQKNGNWKISVRTNSIDANAICSVLGGGGHKRAAGCECSGTPFDVKVILVSLIEKELGIS